MYSGIYCMLLELVLNLLLQGWEPYFNSGLTGLILKKCKPWPVEPETLSSAPDGAGWQGERFPRVSVRGLMITATEVN
jgi:hypothetical protein